MNKTSKFLISTVIIFVIFLSATFVKAEELVVLESCPYSNQFSLLEEQYRNGMDRLTTYHYGVLERYDSLINLLNQQNRNSIGLKDQRPFLLNKFETIESKHQQLILLLDRPAKQLCALNLQKQEELVNKVEVSLTGLRAETQSYFEYLKITLANTIKSSGVN